MKLEVKDLNKSYGTKHVLKGIDFSVESGQALGLLGRNGAGKTTTIRILMDVFGADSGEILMDGKLIDHNKISKGYLPEERGLYPKYTLLDQLLYFAKLKGVGRSKAMEKIKYWSGRLQLDEYIFPPKNAKGRPVKSMRAEQLSKGNQQKVQLMAALLSDPEFVILDEPMSGLDPVNTDLFKEVIRDEISKDKYVIMSSHQMPTIEEFCSDIIIMNRGNVVLQGNLNEIKKSYGRVNLYVKCEQPIDQFIEAAGLTIIEETPAETQLRVTGEEQAMAFLNTLLANRITVIRFDLREPSLHEIFVEKVGAGNEE